MDRWLRPPIPTLPQRATEANPDDRRPTPTAAPLRHLATAYNLDFPKVLLAMEAPTVSFTSPSLVRAADFLTDPYNPPLGTYYLYFANHRGGHIRMAYANALEGPWTIYNGG